MDSPKANDCFFGQQFQQDMVHLILCLLVFWTIARDKAAEGDTARTLEHPYDCWV